MRLYNLTPEQYEILSAMWQLKTSEELEQWQRNLPSAQLRQSIVLKNLMMAEYIDAMTKDYTEFHEVATLLGRIFKS